MSAHSVVERQPQAVELDGTDGNTLLVAAPALGPEAEPTELVAAHAVADHLDSGARPGGEGDGDVRVLPDLYASYREADDADGLETALDTGVPLAAVVTPHELDWLLGSDSAFTESHLAGFDRIVELRYDPDGSAGAQSARAAVVAAAETIDVDDPGLTRRRNIWSALETFAYDHEYEHDGLAAASTDDRYGPTLTPAVAAYVSTAGRATDDDFQAVSPKAVRAAFDADAGGHIVPGGDLFRDVANTVAGGLGVANGTAAATALAGGAIGTAGVPAAVAAVGFVAWVATREGDDGTVPPVFELLDDGRVPPPTQARLEAALGAPPGTVEVAGELARPASLRRLRNVLGDGPETIREVEEALDATDADGLDTALATLDRRTATLESLHEEALARGAKELDAVADELQSDEAALLGPSIDPEEIDPDHIPWVEVIEDGDSGAARQSEEPTADGEDDESDADGGDDDPPVRVTTRAEVAAGEAAPPAKIREIVDATSDNSVVVLRGGHGTGKTTATYRAGRVLEERGYTVRVPGFSSESSTLDVRRRLRRDAGDDPLALVISYERAIAGETLDGEFRTLRNWTDEGFVDTVLVECREEFYDQFTDENEFSSQTDELIDLERFDSRVAVGAVAQWVFGTLDRVGELAEPYADEELDEEEFRETMMEILRLSRGNSEVAKVAAKFAFADGYSLDEIDSHDDLIRADVEHLIETLGGSTDESLEAAFGYLATARELRTRDLSKLRRLEGVNLYAVAEALSGYLNSEVRREVEESEGEVWVADRESGVEELRWRLSPSVYADVTFRRLLDESAENDAGFGVNYDDLRQLPLDGDNPPQLHRNVARNLRIAHEAARRRVDQNAEELDREGVNAPDVVTVSPARVEAQAQNFVDRLGRECEPGSFVRSLVQFSFGPVPVDPSVFDDTQRLLNGAADEAGRRDVERADVLHNVLGSQLAANVEESERRAAVVDAGERFTTAAAERDGYDSGRFLSNVYSIAISKLADSHDLEEASEWTGWLTDRADTAAAHGSHDYDPAQFLSNVYSMAISKLADSHDPTEVTEWTDWLTDHVNTAAVHGNHDDDPASFLENVYSMAIEKFADSYSPAEAGEWTDWVYEAIQRHGSSDTHGLADGEFVADCCAVALSNVTPELPAVESAWHEEVLTRSLDATPATALARFYARYTNAVTQVDVNLIWQSWIVRDCLDRTIYAEQPVTDESAELAASVVANTLFGLAANADNGLGAVPTLPDTVAAVATDDRKAFETLLDGVETRYADGDVSEWVLNDPESTDVRAVGRRVLAWVRGRAFVHALTHPGTDTLADDIHNAAVESAHEASEPDVPLDRFYRVALVGLAAETDPEGAVAHDNLLGDALQHEAIDSPGFCAAYFNGLSSSDSYLPSHASGPNTFDWCHHLVDDLLTRAETDAAGLLGDHEKIREVIARMLAVMADGTYPASGPTDAFHTLLDTVADHDTDAPVTAHAVERVPEFLDEEYTNLLAKFDWEERFE